MTQLRAAFFFLAPGLDPADRTVWADELSRAVLVPVPDGAAAARIAGELAAQERLDLIELYGGLGPVDAAAVLAATGGGTVPVGLVGIGAEPAEPFGAIIVAPGVDPVEGRLRAGRLDVVPVASDAEAPAAAAELVAAGARRIELCGGMGALPGAAVAAAVDVPVATVLFGFESLPAVAAYREAYAAAAA